MQHDLGAIGRFDHHVGLGETALEIAALGASRATEERPPGDGLVGVEQRLELLPVDRDQPKCRLGLLERVGTDGCDGLALVLGRVGEHRDLARADPGPHAGRVERRREVDPCHAGARVGASQDRGVEHPRKLQIGRVERLAAGPAECVGPGRRLPDDLAGPRRPLLERILLDDEEDLLEPALDLLLGADQSRHVRIASSIFG